MVYEPRVIFSGRPGRRTHCVGPRGAPVIGYRPAPLVAATPRIGRASRIGRCVNKVIRDNLKRLWIWPQCHYDTCKKRMGFFKSRFKRDFVQLYEVDHTVLGMLTRSSWDILRESVCHRLNPSERRRRPDINSPDPNTVRAYKNAEKKRRNLQRRRRSKKRRRPVVKAPAVVPPPPPPPPPVIPVAPPFSGVRFNFNRVAVEERSAFSREMERNEILRRQVADYSTSSSGPATSRLPFSVTAPEDQEPQDVPGVVSFVDDTGWHCSHPVRDRRPCFRYHSGGRPDNSCRECCNLEHRRKGDAPPPWKVVPGLESILTRRPEKDDSSTA